MFTIRTNRIQKRQVFAPVRPFPCHIRHKDQPEVEVHSKILRGLAFFLFIYFLVVAEIILFEIKSRRFSKKARMNNTERYQSQTNGKPAFESQPTKVSKRGLF